MEVCEEKGEMYALHRKINTEAYIYSNIYIPFIFIHARKKPLTCKYAFMVERVMLLPLT